MFITSKNKYLSNDMKIFGTCSIPLRANLYFKNNERTVLKNETLS